MEPERNPRKPPNDATKTHPNTTFVGGQSMTSSWMPPAMAMVANCGEAATTLPIAMVSLTLCGRARFSGIQEVWCHVIPWKHTWIAKGERSKEVGRGVGGGLTISATSAVVGSRCTSGREGWSRGGEPARWVVVNKRTFHAHVDARSSRAKPYHSSSNQKTNWKQRKHNGI